MTVLVISCDLDGNAKDDGTTNTGITPYHIGENLSPKTRSFYRFPLSGIPTSATISDVDISFVFVTGPDNGDNGMIGVNPYGGQPGNRNIVTDNGATRYTNCAGGTTYAETVVSGSETAGETRTFDLGATADANLQTCVTAGDSYWTLAINNYFMSSGNGSYIAGILSATYAEVKITVTYTVPDITKTPNVVNLNISIPTANPSGGNMVKTPAVINLVSSVPATVSGTGHIKSPAVLTLTSSIPLFSLSRAYNPDTFAGKVGVGFITQGNVSSVSGDTDATGVKLIVQSGTSLLGFGLNRDGSPWLPGGTSDLGGCISGAGVNLSELIFPRPMKLTRVVVHTKNMNETRGDSFQLALMLDGDNTARNFGAPIKQNGRSERYINPGWGYVSRCVLQISYSNTPPTDAITTIVENGTGVFLGESNFYDSSKSWTVNEFANLSLSAGGITATISGNNASGLLTLSPVVPWPWPLTSVTYTIYSSIFPTSSSIKDVPCAITKIELFGKPTGKKLISG